jgi:hypothetical protein
MMKKYVTIVLLTFMFFAFSGFALADKITIQNEVSLKKQQGNTPTSPAGKENRLSSKRIKDKIDAGRTSGNSSTNERMIRYKQFPDGEGEVKTKY